VIRLFTTVLLLCCFASIASAQGHYYKKVEVNYLNYQTATAQYDIPDSGWLGPPLNNGKNGMGLSLSNGIGIFSNKIAIGLGLGYLNFEGVNGLSLFGELELRPIDESFAPFATIKIGYSHIWNQYLDGNGSLLSDFEGGLLYKISPQKLVYIKTGILFTQESSFIPISAGFVF
jgi:hypothetical protein